MGESKRSHGIIALVVVYFVAQYFTYIYPPPPVDLLLIILPLSPLTLAIIDSPIGGPATYIHMGNCHICHMWRYTNLLSRNAIKNITSRHCHKLWFSIPFDISNVILRTNGKRVLELSKYIGQNDGDRIGRRGNIQYLRIVHVSGI